MKRPPSPTRRILFVHYRDNVSGAPRVLADVVRWARDRGFATTVLTSPTEGFLHGIEGVEVRPLSSRFGQSGSLPGWMRFLHLQIEASLEVVRARIEGCDTVYFNTLFQPLPLLVSRFLFRTRVVHLHEEPRPAWVGMLLFAPVRWFATDMVFVSRYARDRALGGTVRGAHLVSNGVPELADPSGPRERFGQGRVVLVASLAPFKGLDAFVALAARCPDLAFRLALDATPDQARERLGSVPANLELLCGVRDRARLFGDASVVVNMTLPRLRAETFGLTIAEAMSWGIPVVVPPAGGIMDLVDDGRTGFVRDPEDLEAMERALRALLSDRERYLSVSGAAHARSAAFSMARFHSAMERVLPDGSSGAI